MGKKLDELSDDEAVENAKANFQRALDAGNKAGLEDVKREQEKKKGRVARLLLRALKELGI